MNLNKIKNILLTAYSFLFKPAKAPNRPLYLQLEVTNACNSRCQMCNHRETIKNPGFMSLKEFKKIVDEVKPATLNLTGMGESFLNKDFLEMVSYAKSKGIPVGLATNFTLVGDKIKEICGSGLDMVKVSIDSSNKKNYKKIRGIDCFELVTENIRKLQEFKEKHGLEKPELRLNFALQRDNLDELDEVVGMAKDFRAKAVYVQYMEFVNMEYKKKVVVGNLSFNELKEKLEKGLEKANTLKVKTNIPILLRDLGMYYNKMRPAEEFRDTGRVCHFPWTHTYIEFNGDVRPCQMFVWKRGEGILGNVLRDGFEGVWNNKKYVELRKKTKMKERPYLPCESCIPQTFKNLAYLYNNVVPGWGKK